MLRNIILTYLVACCPKSNGLSESEFKIIGGTLATISDVPYQASIRFNGQHNCGGGIIGYDIILTAAHCVEGAIPSQVSIYVGTSYLYRNGLVSRVASVITHNLYIKSTSENDIAVIKLRKKLPFRPSILPIALPKENEEIPSSTMSLITGWGRVKEFGSISNQLRKVYVSIIDRKTCGKMYQNENVVTNTMICAGHVEGGKDACQGDSGGPLIANGKLQGIVSWGLGCARKEYPGVYTQVSKYRAWIKEKSGI